MPPGLAKGSHVHLVGICGTAMASLAGMLHARGHRVTGSDEGIYPPMSTQLASLGIDVRPFSESSLDPLPTVVVIGNAIRRGNPEAERVLNEKIPFTSMPALLREEFLHQKRVSVIAGTHGKTTTSAMVAHVLSKAGRDPSYLIGGVLRDFARSYAVGSGEDFVIEGDEYDTAFFDKGPKFLHYLPDTVVLNSVEFDHADIFPDIETVRIQFRRLVNIIPGKGLLLAHTADPGVQAVINHALCRVESFGLNQGADWRAIDVEHTAEGTSFTVLHRGERLERLGLRMPGEFNVRNALAAMATAAEAGVDPAASGEILRSFRGVRRRQETRGEERGVIVLDDFAHHPTAIGETLRAVRMRHPAGRIWAVIEPRSWSLRRNVFQDRLPESFEGADRILIAPVYRADMLPADERLDIGRLVTELRRAGREAEAVEGADAIIERIADEARPGDVVVAMSNGAFGGIHERLLAALRVKSPAG